MSTFTIDSENNITGYASGEAIPDGNTERFTNETELAELAANWPAARLVELWNSIPGFKPIKRFTDRKTAVARIWKATQSLVSGAPAPDVAPKPARLSKRATRKPKAPAARDGSKKADIIRLLERAKGATLAELMTATGWQAHSVRGFISGTLGKRLLRTINDCLICGITLLRSIGGSFAFCRWNPTTARGSRQQLWTLTDCVRAGTAITRDETADRGQDWTEAFIAAMHRNASERASLVVHAVSAENVRRILDVGSGSGAYSIAFARANSALRADILDLATVEPIARRHIQEAGVADRVHVRAGDLRSDRLGEGYDLVFVSAICHMLSAQENLDLLRRCRELLAPGGRVVIQDFILEADKTAPRFAALFALNMLVGTRGGSSYNEPEYAAWLGEGGSVRSATSAARNHRAHVWIAAVTSFLANCWTAHDESYPAGVSPTVTVRTSMSQSRSKGIDE